MKDKFIDPLETKHDSVFAKNNGSGLTKKLFNKNVYTDPMAILNACIRDLSNQKFEIKKVAIFEDPPQAILHIKKNSSVKPQEPWYRKFRDFKATNTALTCVKLYVTKTSDTKRPFHLNYEFIPTEVS